MAQKEVGKVGLRFKHGEDCAKRKKGGHHHLPREIRTQATRRNEAFLEWRGCRGAAGAQEGLMSGWSLLPLLEARRTVLPPSPVSSQIMHMGPGFILLPQ